MQINGYICSNLTFIIYKAFADKNKVLFAKSFHYEAIHELNDFLELIIFNTMNT